MANKAIVKRILELLALPLTPEVKKEVASFYAPTMTCHHLGISPWVGTGEQFVEIIAAYYAPEGKLIEVEVRKIIADENEVWSYIVVKGAKPETEIIDMYTFNNEGKIVEQWDCQQAGRTE